MIDHPMIIRIKNLRASTIIGINDWERDTKQEIIINVTMEFDGRKASETDDIKHTVDYKSIKKKILKEVENTQFYLVEKLVNFIMDIVMESPLVMEAVVEVDKPHALRFADSVSVQCRRTRES